MIKAILIVAFLLIISSLGSALYHLVKHKEDVSSQKTARALTFRISLSILLFIFVFILIATGIIKPHGIGSRIQPQNPTITESNKSHL
jgi:O-antigen/teichoic acid export membrane protein